jgi:hypothetical protein
MPDELYRALLAAAKREHRSLTQQVLVTIQNGLRDVRPQPVEPAGAADTVDACARGACDFERVGVQQGDPQGSEQWQSAAVVPSPALRRRAALAQLDEYYRNTGFAGLDESAPSAADVVRAGRDELEGRGLNACA